MFFSYHSTFLQSVGSCGEKYCKNQTILVKQFNRYNFRSPNTNHITRCPKSVLLVMWLIEQINPPQYQILDYGNLYDGFTPHRKDLLTGLTHLN